ncbi:MAG: FliG C-terminal domain-containing protein, partial [Actinomycetota bacterium]
EIISHLPDDLKVKIGIRLGTMNKVPADAMLAVERGLQSRLTTLLESQRHEITGGVDSLVDLLTVADKSLEETMLTGMSDQAAELAAQVRAKLFTFADIELIDDRQMQTVLRHVDAGRLPLALKGTADLIRDKFLNNLSSRARENLLDELELLGSVRMADVEDAQAEILEVIRGLEESGDLVINRGGGDFVS